MTVIQFRSDWKRRYGTVGAMFLDYLVSQEESPSEWFPANGATFAEEYVTNNASTQVARERLRADQVIDVRRVGVSYQYRINHDRLAELSADEQTA